MSEQGLGPRSPYCMMPLQNSPVIRFAILAAQSGRPTTRPRSTLGRLVLPRCKDTNEYASAHMRIALPISWVLAGSASLGSLIIAFHGPRCQELYLGPYACKASMLPVATALPGPCYHHVHSCMEKTSSVQHVKSLSPSPPRQICQQILELKQTFSPLVHFFYLFIFAVEGKDIKCYWQQEQP